MHLFVVFVLTFVATFAISALLPGRWSVVAWLVPLGLAVLFFVLWLDESRPPETGDNQPGLVALVGVLVVLLAAGAVGLGRLTRR